MRVLIVDDHKPFVDSLSRLLRNQIENVEVSDAGTLEEGIRKATEWRADITLLDPGLPDATQKEVLESIDQGCFPPPVIVITANEGDAELLKFAYRCGALGYFEKRSLNGNLVQSIHDNYLHYALYVRPRHDAGRK